MNANGYEIKPLANLTGANLTGADLRGTNLTEANLTGADLRGANFWGAYLRGAYLRGADLRGAYLQGADLTEANFWGAYLRGAYLRGADLRGADLRGADLRGTNLTEANLQETKLPDGYEKQDWYLSTRIIPEGDVIGWKMCQNGVIVKLKIPADARRFNAMGLKCRAEYAEVLEVIGAGVGYSQHDNTFAYRKGETVRPDTFDPDWRNECSEGIHFFITRTEAEKY